MRDSFFYAIFLPRTKCLVLRMTAARLGYRTDQRKELEALRNENAVLRDRIDQLLHENAELRSKMK